MLPAGARLRSSDDFRTAVRGGRRIGRSTLVLHATPNSTFDQPVKVGFVVSKAVGNAVTRNRVKRRMRHLCRGLLDQTPQGMIVVVRALPAAATQPRDVETDLTSAWRQLMSGGRR